MATLLNDAVYLKYADEYKALLDSIDRSFVGKKAQIISYNAAINGRIGTITEVRLIGGGIYFHLDNGGLSFEPNYLQLMPEGAE